VTIRQLSSNIFKEHLNALGEDNNEKEILGDLEYLIDGG